MAKALIFIILLAAAIIAAAVFGALHNQVSYAVAPEYFHKLKFAQFGLKSELHTAEGASIIGVLASWWMGLVIGVPVLALGLRIPGAGAYFRAGCTAILMVLLIAGVCGLLGLGLATLVMTPEMAQMLPLPSGLTDPVRFGRVAVMHECSYIGGALGLVVALIYTHRKRRT